MCCVAWTVFRLHVALPHPCLPTARLPCRVGPFAGAILAVPFHLFFASRMLEGRAPAPDPLAQPGTGAGTESPVGKVRDC